jgi:hypothetical protein
MLALDSSALYADAGDMINIDSRTEDTIELECGSRVVICLCAEVFESHSAIAMADLFANRLRTFGRWA